MVPKETLFALFTLLLAWWVVALWLQQPDVLPMPQRVAEIAWGEAQSGRLAKHMLATLARVAAAFALAMTIGTLAGYALGRLPRVNRWADPFVIVLLNLPALVLIVLCYLWIGLNEAAAITAVAISKTVNVLVTVREGARTLDSGIADMARVYRFGPWKTARHVILPQLGPYISAAARNGIAIIWKLVMVVEFLGRPDGIGYQIHLYFQLFEIGHVLAYSLSFVVLMLAIEYLLIQPVERRSTRWRGPTGATAD